MSNYDITITTTGDMVIYDDNNTPISTTTGDVVFTATTLYNYAPYIPHPKTHTTMDMPQPGIPEKIFIDGKLKTAGILGSEAQVYYQTNKLIFGHYSDLGVGSTLTLEFHDYIYHYKVSNVPIETDSNKYITAELISQITKHSCENKSEGKGQ